MREGGGGCVFFLISRRPPRSTQSRSSAASDVYKRQFHKSLPLLPAGIRSAKPAVQGAPNIRKTKVNVKERSI